MNTNNKIEMGRMVAKEKIEKTIKMIEKLPKAVKYSNVEFDDFGVSRKICTDVNLYNAFKNQTQWPATLTKAKTNVKKNLSWEWSNSGYPLNTPALEEAYDRKILNEQNYKRILSGGFIAVERFSDTSSHMRNCYNAIKEESFNCLVSIKKEKFAKERLVFDKELTLSKVIADADGVKLLEEEFPKNSPLTKIFN